MSLKMEQKIELTNEEKKRWHKSLGCFVILIVVAFGVLLFPDVAPKTEPEMVEFSSVEKICELATLRCFYHDVAEYEDQPDGLFKYGLFKYGYKKMWIEYDGIVEVGIEVSEVKVQQPDKNGIVKVYVPEAKVLTANADEKSMGDPYVKTGKFTKITVEDQSKAFAEAQKNMKKNAESDKIILLEAHNNAKALLKEYIINVGEQMGKSFAVEWIGEPVLVE